MIDLNQVNDSQFIPISEEERLINQLKPLAFNSIRIWIENVTGKNFTFPNDFRKSLANGVLLCNLLNNLKPGTIKRINKSSTALSGYDESSAIDNLGKFLRCCEDDFGLSPLILFELSDFEDLSEKSSSYQLESEKRLERVLMCLFHLAKSVENHLTHFTIDSNPFQLLLKSQDIREMKKNKTAANMDDSVFESPVPELIQKQTPNYLAHKAEQTLKQTKMNQEILHKSLENDDWQESLENWREKRRQVQSQSIVETVNNDFHQEDSKELIKLKEKARKMKQLRDQIKDQSIQAINDEGDCKSGSSIPDIDEEMKAMIERVKMKKLAEEQKRQFSLSSPIKSSFASDSEPSTSTALEKLEDSLSISEKNENDRSYPHGDNQLHKDVIDNNIASNNHLTKPDEIPHDSVTRIVQIKLIQRSKQDSDPLWGMDLADKSGIVLVSRVKIGSTSDVCDVRKGDEIISINSTNVTNQSVEYVKSIFIKYVSTLSPTEFITLSLKRIVDDDEDEDFLCSDISETVDDNQHQAVNESEFDNNSKTHLNHNDFKSIASNFEQIDNLHTLSSNSEMYPSITKEIPKDLYQKADKNVIISETVERRRNYDENVSSNLLNNISNLKPEIPRLVKNTNETDNESQLSVQAKIAKFECQKIANSLNLNSSLNISETPQNPEFSVTNTKLHQQSSCDGLSLKQDDISSKLTEENHSSISNLYHFWETEAPKSITSSSRNIINKNAPSIQNPIHSLVNEKEKSGKFVLEAAEQHLDNSNINIVKTWRNGRSSGNSSTSDDVSALNESLNMPQYGTWSKSLERTRENPVSLNEKSNSSISLTREFSPVAPASTSSENKFASTDINYHPKSNVSTGIQANLQSRQQPIYTTITTAFESQSHKPATNSVSKISDEESYSITSTRCPGNIGNFTGTLTPSSEMGLPIKNPQMSWLPSNNKNDLSKDFTLISPSIIGKENQKNLSDTYSSQTIGSNISRCLDEKEKSIDVEVSGPPKLFPMKNKTLLSRFSNDKILVHGSSDPNIKNQSFEEDETTLKSNYIKITDLDKTVTPINQTSKSYVKIDNEASLSRKEDSPYLEITKMKKTPIQYAVNCTDIDSFEKHQISNCYDVLESNIDIEPTITTIPAPTLFKSNKDIDNTISVGITLSKSENFIPNNKNESCSSDKKSRKSNSKNNELQKRKSSSTKDLRYCEVDKSNDLNKSNTTSRSNHRKHSPSQVTFSDVIQDITQTKTQTKTYSIEKSAKTTPILLNREKKKSKSQNKKSSPAELSTKCNNCLQAAGSEDLMVIEELNLHFHLRCFTCSECHVQLGDGKSDTDVRIRRSKLHCATCYNRKSSKSKHKSSTVNRQQQSLSNNISNKGGHGDGHNVYIAPGDSNNNCVFPTVITSVPSTSFITFTNSSSLIFND